jgi:DNA-binding NtrC family response regulator
MSLPVLMVIDDEIGVRESLRMVFAKDYRMLVADSVDAALPKVQEERPQVILLDIVMPKTDGIEVLKQIKVIHPDCEVIMLTALNTRQLAAMAADCGAFDIVGKPFDIDDLRGKVNGALAKLSRRSQSPPPQP